MLSTDHCGFERWHDVLQAQNFYLHLSSCHAPTDLRNLEMWQFAFLAHLTNIFGLWWTLLSQTQSLVSFFLKTSMVRNLAYLVACMLLGHTITYACGMLMLQPCFIFLSCTCTVTDLWVLNIDGIPLAFAIAGFASRFGKISDSLTRKRCCSSEIQVGCVWFAFFLPTRPTGCRRVAFGSLHRPQSRALQMQLPHSCLHPQKH